MILANTTLPVEVLSKTHWRHFQTRKEARQAIFAYTEGFYNTRRVQKRLGYLSPIEWLNQYNKLVLEGVA